MLPFALTVADDELDEEATDPVADEDTEGDELFLGDADEDGFDAFGSTDEDEG